ncbi:scoloptoxin SSD14-like isoform X2 [Centruroides vittatus]|uniref:scoloptoxin SSD14-like isoform X2 n=1 Tax=Centruroides vittatus TaxID=120091 RepID=UPI00350EB1D7
MVEKQRSRVTSYDVTNNEIKTNKSNKNEDERIEENFIEFFKWRLNLSKRGKICFGVLAFIVLLLLSGFISYFVLTWNSKPSKDSDEGSFDQLYKPSNSELGIYERAAISTDTKPCAAIGKDILKKNGNAVETAIATLVCMGAVNSHSMGLGGGFIMTIYDKKEDVVSVLDAREIAPEAASENMFNGDPTRSQMDGLAVAVPGELSGYEAAYNRYKGNLTWKELFTPTIELCRKGFEVTRHLAMALEETRDIVLNETTLRNVYFNNETGDLYKEGEIMTRLDLADTLEKIANSNSDILYGRGETQRKFLQDIANYGGIITENDMLKYTPVWRKPTKISLNNGFTVYSAPPPGSGCLLSYMLNVLDGYNLTKEANWKNLDQISLTFHRALETFKFAYAQRMNLEQSDDHSVKQTVKNLQSKSYADQTRAKIYDTKTIHDPEYYGFKQYVKEDGGTGHLSVISPSGDAVSVTSSINLYFGAKFISSSTGIVLNNQMDDFSLPNITNYFGIPPSERNRIKPGRRPMSSMSPTIILDDKGETWLVIGGNGGSRITSGIALVTMQLLWLGQDVKEAIDMPRVHHQLFPDHIIYEKVFPKEILRKLQELGHETEENVGRMSVMMAIHRSKDGKLHANADYRKNGKTDGF